MNLSNVIKWSFRRLARGKPIFCDMSVLDYYVKSVPTHQNALDVFKGEWMSRVPCPAEELKAGETTLFEDARIHWAEEHFGGFRDCDVLELGPLEAGHTYMVESMGAKSIVAIEGNTHAYLKCLIAKEILQLKRARFLLGDFVAHLKKQTQTFDICLASGVLYHMIDPAELLSLIAKVSDKIVLWTHYYDEEIVGRDSNLASKFAAPVAKSYEGFEYNAYKYSYKDALVWAGFCGGSNPYSHWMTKEDILGCLRTFGFEQFELGFEHTDHPHGPAFAVVARKSNASAAQN